MYAFRAKQRSDETFRIEHQYKICCVYERKFEQGENYYNERDIFVHEQNVV